MITARIDTKWEKGDLALELSGVKYLEIPVGESADVYVDHAEEGSFYLSEMRYVTEPGVTVHTLEEHVTDSAFAFRVTNEGGGEPYEPYRIYGTEGQVYVQFIRRGIKSA